MTSSDIFVLVLGQLHPDLPPEHLPQNIYHQDQFTACPLIIYLLTFVLLLSTIVIITIPFYYHQHYFRITGFIY